MIFGTIPSTDNRAFLVSSEYDPYPAIGSVGSLSFRRAKRSGRNPATGARNSKKFGLTMIFVTGYAPLTTSDGYPIY